MPPTSGPPWYDALANAWPLLAAAPFVGSFLGTLAFRVPRGESAAWGRSACPACRAPLGPVDLVPLFGWVLRRGHCARCGAPIALAYPLIEVTAVALPAWAALSGLAGWPLWAVAMAGWALLTLAAIDLRHFLLPDLLTLPLAAGGLFLAVLGAPAWPVGATDSAVGLVAGFGVIWGVGWAYRRLRGREGIGLGDAKLLAAGGAWTGWQGLASVVLIAALAGLALALAESARKRRGLKPLARVPFGVCLALGIWLVVLYGPLAF